MKGIQYLSRQQLNIEKWDACIEAAPNGLIYAYSFYLDNLSKQWDALVLNDYEVVMPLTWNKKYRIHYLYQPPFTASLGLFGNNINAELVSAFLLAIPSKFKYWDFSLNNGNLFWLNEFSFYERSNYVLDLRGTYEKLIEGYKENVTRNITKSKKLNDVVKKGIDVDEVIALASEQLSRLTNLQLEDFKRFKDLYKLLSSKKMATTYGVYAASGQLLASAVFFFSNGRAYYILVGNHPNSKATGASHRLIDAFIKDHAEKKLLLDFEGSDIRNLAFFYSSFGASLEKYPAIKLNKLPRLIKWIKNI